jgi:ABC-type Fe3+/spermidine/putrescine transport system ATPase subunit
VGDAALRGVSDGALAPGSEAWLTVRPEAIRLVSGDDAVPDDHNLVAGTVSDAVYAGSTLRVHVELPSGQRLVASVPSGTGVAHGAPVRLAWPVEQGRCVGD